MSCGGRKFADVGRKLLLTIPLLTQKIDKSDSVLGPYVTASGYGLGLQNLYHQSIQSKILGARRAHTKSRMGNSSPPRC
jgi:hypothetical protein